jgi:hypothetical protein
MVDHRVVVRALPSPRLAKALWLVWVGKCMCVVFTETKKDLLALICRWIKSTARLVMSSSIVTIRAMQGLDCVKA